MDERSEFLDSGTKRMEDRRDAEAAAAASSHAVAASSSGAVAAASSSETPFDSVYDLPAVDSADPSDAYEGFARIDKDQPCNGCASLSSDLLSAQLQISDLQSRLLQRESKLHTAIRQNGVLLKNLSVMFVTAQKEIANLRTQLDAANGSAAFVATAADTLRVPMTTAAIGGSTAPATHAASGTQPSRSAAVPTAATQPPAATSSNSTAAPTHAQASPSKRARVGQKEQSAAATSRTASPAAAAASPAAPVAATAGVRSSPRKHKRPHDQVDQ